MRVGVCVSVCAGEWIMRSISGFLGSVAFLAVCFCIHKCLSLLSLRRGHTFWQMTTVGLGHCCSAVEDL